jgi:hypothetical protein
MAEYALHDAEKAGEKKYADELRAKIDRYENEP